LGFSSNPLSPKHDHLEHPAKIKKGHMQTTIDGKKLTVKHFVNNRIKPNILDDDYQEYPIYTQVTYNRVNTKFRSDSIFTQLDRELGITPNLVVRRKKKPRSVEYVSAEDFPLLEKVEERVVEMAHIETSELSKYFPIVPDEDPDILLEREGAIQALAPDHFSPTGIIERAHIYFDSIERITLRALSTVTKHYLADYVPHRVYLEIVQLDTEEMMEKARPYLPEAPIVKASDLLAIEDIFGDDFQKFTLQVLSQVPSMTVMEFLRKKREDDIRKVLDQQEGSEEEKNKLYEGFRLWVKFSIDFYVLV
jgi:hypothetical protein